MGCAGEFGWVKIIFQQIFIVEASIDSVIIDKKFVRIWKKAVELMKNFIINFFKNNSRNPNIILNIGKF